MINFKMSCSIVHKRYPVSSSNENFIEILIRISKYVVPIRLGRKDKRNLKAKPAVCSILHVSRGLIKKKYKLRLFSIRKKHQIGYLKPNDALIVFSPMSIA